MISQILVVDPAGPCVVDRTYDSDALDPFLISGFLAAVIPSMDEFGLTMESIKAQVSNKEDSYLGIEFTHGWIVASIATRDVAPNKLTSLMCEIGDLTHRYLGSPMGYVDQNLSTISELEDNFDMVISQQGIDVAPKDRDNKVGILPILRKVYEGKESPKDAAKFIIKAIEEQKFDEVGLKNMKKTLELIDNMLPKSKGSKMDQLQEIIQSTYKGVSRMIVRMDNALMF